MTTTAQYNAKFKALLDLDAERKRLKSELAEVSQKFDAAKEEVIEAMFENDNKAAEEMFGFRVTRSMTASVSFNPESDKERAMELIKSVGYDDAIKFNPQRMTSCFRDLFPEAFEDKTQVDLSKIPDDFKEFFRVFDKPNLSIRKKS